MAASELTTQGRRFEYQRFGRVDLGRVQRNFRRCRVEYTDRLGADRNRTGRRRQQVLGIEIVDEYLGDVGQYTSDGLLTSFS